MREPVTAELEALVLRVIDTCDRTIALYDAEAKTKREEGLPSYSVGRHSLGSVRTGLNAILRAVREDS